MSSILAILTGRGHSLSGTDHELLIIGSAVATATKLPLHVAVLGADVEATSKEAANGADVVFAVQHTSLGGGEAASYLAAIARVLTEDKPAVILFGPGVREREVAARLAARLGGAVVTNCASLHAVDNDTLEAVSPIFGGAAEAVYQFSLSHVSVVAMRPGSAAGITFQHKGTGKITLLDAQLDHAPTRIKLIDRKVAPGPKLEEAKTIVAGGTGLLKQENYRYIEQLATVLGGMPAASRAIVDRGWATPAQQVGLTGRVVTPRLYLAVGISGASQHMAGCSASEAIVAVNLDKDAPIMRYAKYGVVADSVEFMQAFTDACREVRRASP